MVEARGVEPLSRSSVTDAVYMVVISRLRFYSMTANRSRLFRVTLDFFTSSTRFSLYQLLYRSFSRIHF